MRVGDQAGADGEVLFGALKILLEVMDMADSGAPVVQDLGDKLIALIVAAFPTGQHRTAEVRQQMEFLLQPGGAEQECMFHCLHVSIDFICKLPYAIIKFTDF